MPEGQKQGPSQLRLGLSMSLPASAPFMLGSHSLALTSARAAGSMLTRKRMAVMGAE
jgi:hypothetical protein